MLSYSKTNKEKKLNDFCLILLVHIVRIETMISCDFLKYLNWEQDCITGFLVSLHSCFVSLYENTRVPDLCTGGISRPGLLGSVDLHAAIDQPY